MDDYENTHITHFIYSVACVAQVGASLIDRGNGLIYDDVLDLTWLQAKVPNNNGVWTFNFLNGRHPQDDK